MTTTTGPGSSPSRTTRPVMRHPDGSALRVLVVDDEQMLTDLLVDGAAQGGLGGAHRRLAAPTRVQAARDFQPGRVVLDIMMPDLDGMAVLRRLRGRATMCRCCS